MDQIDTMTKECKLYLISYFRRLHNFDFHSFHILDVLIRFICNR